MPALCEILDRRSFFNHDHLLPHFCGSSLDCFNYLQIARAPAEDSASCLSDLIIGRGWVMIKKIFRSQEHGWYAEAALRSVPFHERTLNRAQIVGRS